MKNYIKSIWIVFQCDKFFSSVLFLLAVLSGLTLPVQTSVLNYIINTVNHSKILAKENILLPLILLIIIILFTLLNDYIAALCQLKVKIALSGKFTQSYLDMLNSLDYSYFEDSKAKDLMSRLAIPYETASDSFKAQLLMPGYLITLIGMSFLFIKVSWIFMAAMAVLFTISLYYNLKEVGNLRKLRIKQSVTDRKVSYLSGLLMNKKDAKEIKLFGIADILIGKWKNYTEAMIKERNLSRYKVFMGGIFAQIINFLFITCGVLMLVLLLYKRSVTLGQVIALSAALPGLSIYASWSLPSAISELKRYGDLWEDYFTLVRLKRMNEKGDEEQYFENDLICFDDVYFRYPGTDKYILKGMSFSISAAGHTAIVGRNGAGKSTLIKLLLGLYKPDGGKITYGGININDLPLSRRKEIFSAVFQDSVCYNMTVRENIAMSNIDHVYDDDKLTIASKSGLSYRFIKNLKKGYDTELGNLSGESVTLSGGEVQRLLFTRATMSDAKCIILDEPAAAMDPRGESQMYENFADIKNKRGLIIISHRLASARIADRILVIDDGRVAESGSHRELMQSGALYREMFEKQASWYKQEAEI